MPQSNQLLINLSFVFAQPTGIATYATNLIPHLNKLAPTLLIADQATSWFPQTASYPRYPIPANLSPAQGSKGHLRRLLWTQFPVPQIYQKLKAKLFFSPVPEAPLYSKCRSLVMVHDVIPLRFPNRFSPLTPYYRYYIPQVLAQAKHVICNSHATAKDITQFFAIPAAKITPIHLAYDSKHFQPPSPSSKDRVDTPYFIYIGRHDPHKNLQRLVSAFAKMPNCRDYELWLAGATDSRYTPQLQQQAADLGIAEQLKILEYVSYAQLPQLLQQATAMVFPSLWEGFGIPILEAMACGTPVITSNISSLPEVAGDAAILVNPYRVEEITAAMHQVASDSKMRSQLREAGLKRASEFSWLKTGQETADVLGFYL